MTGSKLLPDLQGKTAVVVGASAGIGKSIATELTALGATVGWCGRRADKLSEAIDAAGGGVSLQGDISTEEGCVAIAYQVEQDMGDVDLLVVASGASGVQMLRDADAAWWDQLLRTNVVGPSQIFRHLYYRFSEQALISVLSSESVGQPYMGLVPYAASKAALEELVRGWRVEHRELRFSRVTVGATDGTDFARDFDPELAGALFTQWVSIGAIPAQVMQATDVGAVIALTLGLALTVPGIDVQDLVLCSPGGPMVLPT